MLATITRITGERFILTIILQRLELTGMRQLFKKAFIRLGSVLPLDNWRKQHDLAHTTDQISQVRLRLHYQSLKADGDLPAFDDVQFRAYSQNGEDGILLYLFSLLGTTNKVCVELGCGDGIECNTANLIVNHGWTGLLVDGNVDNIQRGRNFYRRCPTTKIWPPTLVNGWISAETINDLLTKHEVKGEIDLLSLDLDGVDWWVWQALDVVNPRVILLEFQDILGSALAVTVPYKEDFSAEFNTDQMPDYCGASLRAFVKLGEQKGYRLVGIERYGFNAFFVRNDIGSDLFPAIDPADCFTHPKQKWGRRVRYPRVQNLDWVEV